MSEFKAQCGCTIHVAQWTSKRKIASVKYCETHKAKPLDAEIEELRKDRERLNWLITNEAYVASDRDREVFHIRWEFDCNDEESSSGVNQVGHFDSPREAIDAAMTEGKGDAR